MAGHPLFPCAHTKQRHDFYAATAGGQVVTEEKELERAKRAPRSPKSFFKVLANTMFRGYLVRAVQGKDGVYYRVANRGSKHKGARLDLSPRDVEFLGAGWCEDCANEGVFLDSPPSEPRPTPFLPPAPALEPAAG